MQFTASANTGLSTGRLLKFLCLLWLAGVAMRITILAVPPVIPLIHDDLHMTETQVGLLIGIPLVTWAIAAVPGSLLIARFGAVRTLTVGLLLTGLAAAARGTAPTVWLLYLATLLMGFGIAVMQPAVPTLVREWLPGQVGLGTAVVSNGMLVAVAAGPALTIPMVLPLVGQSWRFDLVAWAAPVLLTAVLFMSATPRGHGPANNNTAALRQWWPDWKNPLIWLLGLTFGSNNALYYGANAFLPDYLANIGRADLTGTTLGWMNFSQLVASFVLLATADKLQRRVWPYFVFGSATLAGVLGIATLSGVWIIVAAVLLGFSLAVTFVVTFALPPVLSAPDDVHRLSAGMFTVSYSLAVVIPVVCGALWDLTGRPWTAFLPLGLCAVTLTALGIALSLHRPAQHAAPL
jgi:CP family cyanate transporter-like MFS transporter